MGADGCKKEQQMTQREEEIEVDVEDQMTKTSWGYGRRRGMSVPCDCGSGWSSYWRYDARGIALMRACEKCWPIKKLRYRPEVLTDPNYVTFEPIDPED